MNKKKWITPFITLVIVCMIGTLLIYPIINMQPKDIVIGVISLDKGAKLPQGEVNLGDKLTKSIQEATGSSAYSSAITWKIYDNEDTLRQDIENGKLHGGLIIPEDFTASKTSSVEGFNKLNDGISKLAEGMRKVDDGTSRFASGVSALPSAAGQLSDGTSALDKGLQTLGAAIGSKESENTLIYASNAVNEGLSGLETALSEQISPDVSDLSQNIDSVKSTEEQIAALLAAADQKLAEGDIDAAKTSIASAVEMSQDLSIELGTISRDTDVLDTKMSRVLDNIATLSAGASKLTAGLESAGSGITNMQTGASKLASGAGVLSDKSSSLVSGADTLSDATGQLNSGVSALSDHVSSMVDSIAEQLTGEQSSAESSSADSGAAIQAVINQGSNVTVSSVVESLITKIFAQAGLDFETDYINPVSAGFSATYFGTCVFIFVYIVSYATGVLLTRNQPLQNPERKSRTKPALIQLLYALGLAICAGIIITLAISLISDMELPVMNTVVFLSISAFALIIVVAGSIDLFGMAGMAIPVLMLVLGIGTANMPYEFLPEIWQKWIYPWMPLQIISNGIKQVVYTGAGWWNNLTDDLMIVVAAGLVLMIIAALKPDKRSVHKQDG